MYTYDVCIELGLYQHFNSFRLASPRLASPSIASNRFAPPRSGSLHLFLGLAAAEQDEDELDLTSAARTRAALMPSRKADVRLDASSNASRASRDARACSPLHSSCSRVLRVRFTDIYMYIPIYICYIELYIHKAITVVVASFFWLPTIRPLIDFDLSVRSLRIRRVVRAKK